MAGMGPSIDQAKGRYGTGMGPSLGLGIGYTPGDLCPLKALLTPFKGLLKIFSRPFKVLERGYSKSRRTREGDFTPPQLNYPGGGGTYPPLP